MREENIERDERQRRKSDRMTELFNTLAILFIVLSFGFGWVMGDYSGNRQLKEQVRWLITNRDEWQDSQERCVSNNRSWQLSYEDAVRNNRNWSTWCSDNPDEARKKLLKTK